MQRTTRALALLVIGAGACNGGASNSSPSGDAPSATSSATSSEPTPGVAPAAGTSDATRVHMNLQELVHLADVDHDGLFVDFGTPARAKYTVGQWKTGWGRDGAEGETTYTNVAGNTGRIYFPLEGDAAVTLRLRLKAVGTATLQPFVNNTALPIVRLEKGGGFADCDVPVPAGVARAGENQLMMRLGGTTRVGDEDVSIALDSLRVIAGDVAAAPAGYVAPTYGSLVREAGVGGDSQKAIVLAAPTTLSYYVEVPKGAKLGLRVAALDGKPAKVLVRATPEGAAASELWSASVGSSWQEKVLALDALAGQVVRLDLVASGQGNVALASPSIVVPRVAVPEAKQAKHVVVLLIDTMRADHLPPFNPQTRVQAPAIARIADEGAIFEAAQSPENWTKPSVASVLTGLYPASHGTKESESRLSDKALMVSEVFQKAGFKTATFLANGYVSDKFGFKQGWDHYTNYIRENKSSIAANVFKEAGDYIEKNKDSRFFVYVQTIDPHVPYDPPKGLLALYDDAEPYAGGVRPRDTPDLLEKAKQVPPKVTFTARDRTYIEALYDAEVTYHDQQLALFVERLQKIGVYDDTLFVITADHGEEFNDHGSWGHGHSVYQELLHVPFMVRFPGAVPAKRRVAEPVGTLDVSPTVLAAAGLPIPDVMEGVNRMPQLAGETPAGPAVAFSDFLDDRRVIRSTRWKLILRGLNPTLFDLASDPGEKAELDLKAHPVALRYCRVLLGQFLGARDRGDWLSAAPKGKSVQLTGEAAEMDAATRAGLKALGYAN